MAPYSIVILRREQILLEFILQRYSRFFVSNSFFGNFISQKTSNYLQITKDIEYLFAQNQTLKI